MYSLSYYGSKGVKMLREATPKDTGKTADAWTYVIRNGRLLFVNRAGPIVQFICDGYMDNGTWVPGYDFVTPVLQLIYEEMKEDRRKDAERHAKQHLRSIRRRLKS